MKYRREVDGLRAVAVIPVILFHAGFHAFKGGFVGVDVFFVISGYLITSIIYADIKDGRFSLVRFYERRARRILPALFAMMAATLPFAWLWLPPEDLRRFAQSLVAVPLFSSNILFWLTSGYFETTTELKPLLHTWSLGVEEQYYVFFPLVLMLAWRFARRHILMIALVAAVISLGFAQWGSQNFVAANFYLLPTRGWELLIGAIVALYLADKNGSQINHAAAEAGGAVGIGLLAASIIWMDKETPFPGLYALAPTLGTALVILCASSKTAVGKLLGSRVFVGIGLVSYSAYLWHQPLFAFAKHKSLEVPTQATLGILSIASLVLACISWKYIEAPFRNTRTFTRRWIFIGAAVGSAAFIAIGVVGSLKKGFPARFNDAPASVLKSLAQSRTTECHTQEGNGNIPLCLIGKTDVPPTAVVYGDSHADAILPAFVEISKTSNQSITHIGLAGCPPLLDVDVINGNYAEGVCERLAVAQLDYARSHKIKDVFLVSRWTLYTDGDYDGEGFYYLGTSTSREKTRDSSRQVFSEAIARTVEAYEAIGSRVHIVEQAPQQRTDARNLYFKLYRLYPQIDINLMIAKSSVDLGDHLRLQKYSRATFSALAERTKVSLIDLDNLFCIGSRCLVGSADASFYFDENHLSEVGARMAADKIMMN